MSLASGHVTSTHVREVFWRATRLHHQCAEKTWKQSVDSIWRVPLKRLLPGLTAGTRRNLQNRRSYVGTLRVRVHAVVCLQNLEGSQLRRPRPPDIFTTAAVPGRGAALDVCVAQTVTLQGRSLGIA